MKRFLLIAAIAAATGGASAENFLDRSSWSWSTSSDCAADGNDIGGIAAIADGNENTCWHSNWHASDDSPERRCPHWVMIDRGSDSTPFYGLANLPRRMTANNACVSYYIYLSDTAFSDVPADSEENIVATLGQPDYEGAWAGDAAEKYALFNGKASTARYILFVHRASANSSSGACAEMNLLTRSGYNSVQGGGSSATYNAVKITTAAGDEHRIAIDGRNLSIAMNGSAIRLANSGITVEYAPEEVAHFMFENYAFDEADPYYYGTKTDANTRHFDLTVTPVDGAEVGVLREVRIAPAAGALPTVNDKCTLPVTISRQTSNSTKVIVTVTPAELAAMGSATDGCYILTGFEEKKATNYILEIPADLLVDSEGALSNALTATWNVTGVEPEPDPDPEPTPEPGPEDSIDEVGADCPTLTFSRRGDLLVIGGIGAGTSAVRLIGMNGIVAATAPVSASGRAAIAVGSLAKGVYILTANNLTLKITL